MDWIQLTDLGSTLISILDFPVVVVIGAAVVVIVGFSMVSLSWIFQFSLKSHSDRHDGWMKPDMSQHSRGSAG